MQSHFFIWQHTGSNELHNQRRKQLYIWMTDEVYEAIYKFLD